MTAGTTSGTRRRRTTSPQHRLALVMMVRDETAVIERCITSVLPFIDTWVVVDTGSVDGTPEVVSDLLATLPGRLEYHRWVDFGTNRSQLMTLARGAARHLLLIDADMELDVAGEMPQLRRPAYALRHRGRVRHDVVRIVDGVRPWRYVGRTHEVIVGKGADAAPLLDGVAIVHHADGGSRTRKLQRDRELLERSVAEDANDRRAVFYLAQTYRDLHDLNRAEALYRQRSIASHDDEEASYSMWQAAELRGRHDPPGGLAESLVAWQRRPQRAEPLYTAARISRRNGWWSLALAFAEMGAALQVPQDRLFVHLDVYDWAILAERGFARLETGDAAGALADFDAVLAKPDVDESTREAIEAVRWRCLPEDYRTVDRPGTDPLLETLAPSAAFAELTYDAVPDWPRFNPTIVATPDGFTVIVRNANYELLTPGHRMLDETRETRTVNHRVDLDADLGVRSVRQLVDETGRTRYETDIRGYEDVRLVEIDGQLRAVASVRDADPAGWWTMMLLTLEGHRIIDATTIPSPRHRLPEKNWVPFVDGGALRLVYRWGPLQVLDEAGLIVVEHDAPRAAGAWRGGSPGLAWESGWLFVVHEVEHSTVRRYRHRFVHLGQDYSLRASQSFSFTGHRIEFAAGLARDGDRLLVTFGVGDRIAALAVVDVAEVGDMLAADPSRW